MYKLSGTSQIMTHDERLWAKRYARTPGQDVIYVGGKAVARDLLDFEITCNVQPLSGQELLLEREQDRFDTTYWVYMNQTEYPLQAGDLVHRQARWFQVQSAEDWGSYTRSRIVEVDVGPDVVPGPFHASDVDVHSP